MGLNVLIVDDENPSRDYLKDLILELDPETRILEAESAEEAVALLNKEFIDILFCDIQMPEATGFDLLGLLSQRHFELVFITGHSQYAIQAIKEGAADYLLKPIDKSEFRETFKKLKKKIAAKDIRHAPSSELSLSKLAISHNKGVRYIDLKDIIYLEANNSYTILKLVSGEKMITSKPIRRYESKLPTGMFFRIHKSYIINIVHFKEYISVDGDFAVMSDGDKICISRYRLSEFLKTVQEVSGRLKL